MSKIDPRIRALTAINEAIACLDYDTHEGLPTDELIADAMYMLLEARAAYTSKPWPDLPHPENDPAAFEAWMVERIAQQTKDGRQ